MAIVEVEILEKVRDRVLGITPRYDVSKAWKYWSLDAFENATQPGQHRFFQVTWGDDVELDEIFPDQVTQPHIIRNLFVTAVYDVPSRELTKGEHYFAADTADILNTVINDSTYLTADDGELYGLDWLGISRSSLGNDEEKMVVAWEFEIRYRREL